MRSSRVRSPRIWIVRDSTEFFLANFSVIPKSFLALVMPRIVLMDGRP
jgi:hypothetical protein